MDMRESKIVISRFTDRYPPIYGSFKPLYSWHIVAGNGVWIAQSGQVYTTLKGVQKAVRNLKKIIINATVEVDI